MKNINVKAYALLLAYALLHAAAPRVPAGPAPQLAVAPASYAGTYRYKTYRPGKDGYDNILKVEDKGGGRLHVTLSGTYMYRDNGEETMHEGGGEGDATLRGNVATARVTPDGGDAPCRVFIIFEDGEAGVKADSSCGFNVDLDGTYRGGKAGAPRANANAAGPRQVRFDKLSAFVGEYQSNRTGTHYVITSVPAEKVSRVTPYDEGTNRRGLFALSLDESDGDASMSFVTSAALAKNLRATVKAAPGAATLRVTATLVEFVGECDIYRSSFVTKVEGYGEDGSLLWAATGAEPVKVKFKQ
ncbi:MAG TPA: hypothetical protein VJ866_09900 [Pyrinomonadaceae bacterium]|nr:hypothetical protein [Pyrinomonadaceae bacterium]